MSTVPSAQLKPAAGPQVNAVLTSSSWRHWALVSPGLYSARCWDVPGVQDQLRQHTESRIQTERWGLGERKRKTCLPSSRTDGDSVIEVR